MSPTNGGGIRGFGPFIFFTHYNDIETQTTNKQLYLGGNVMNRYEFIIDGMVHVIYADTRYEAACKLRDKLNK